jgi:hypothetical protein
MVDTLDPAGAARRIGQVSRTARRAQGRAIARRSVPLRASTASAIRTLSTGGSGGIPILLVGFELLYAYSQKSEYG